MPVIIIQSDVLLKDIEHHFRVSAGPGAGKTHWLINHIKNVIIHSNRLLKTRKVACITYTNSAVDTILNRLGTSVENVEVSTLHSFLYKHVVKPYASFIADDYNLNVLEMDGHDEINVTFGKLKLWSDNTSQSYLYQDNDTTKAKEKQKRTLEALNQLQWYYDENEVLIIRTNPRKPWLSRIDKYSIKNNSYLELKKLYWNEGILHHDDVLYFSFQLLKKFPFIVQVLRAKFPYLFVDEFQDTNPIQTKILEMIGQEETKVGIIGDKAQSIYVFQGAEPDQFDSFTLPSIVDYQIKDNRRSSNKIVAILNKIRNDIEQVPIKNIDGNPPAIIVGDMINAYNKAIEICKTSDVCTVSRNNYTCNAMKKLFNTNIPNSDLLETLHDVDSNRDRRNLLLACIKAIEFALQKCFKDAVKEMERQFRDKDDKIKGKRNAMKYILFLLSKYTSFENKSLLEFRDVINNNLKNIANLRPGSIKEFYENHTYKQLSVCVKISEDKSLHRTIHKAKGAEFDNVMLILNEKDKSGNFLESKELSFLLSPNLTDEEHRVRYVAISRAKNNLFINVPSLSEENECSLYNIGFETIRL